MKQEFILVHHGVKGQKWGVRRYQNPDGTLTNAGKRRLGKTIKKEREQLENKEYERLQKEYDLDGKMKGAWDYGEKHHLDLDDGGGGSDRAGSRYLKMWDDIENLDEQALNNAKKYANEVLTKKYGKETMDYLAKRQEKIDNAKIIVGMSSLLAVPIGVLTYLIGFAPDSPFRK